MDSWMNLRGKMEKALELFHLVEALSHLDGLITTASPSDVASLLRSHTIRDIPSFHYLAGFPYRGEDLPNLERLIRIFTDFGYDINKTSSPEVQQLMSHGSTALLASVKEQNVIFLECLLRCGAKADICDPQGFTPCHWAIKKGDLKCLQVLLEHGGSALVKSASVSNRALPLLHEAVRNGHLEVVRYLLIKEELGVDVNQKAFYRLSNVHRGRTWCSPLRIALDKKTTLIIQELMKHPTVKASRLEELHSLITNGLTKQLLPLLDYFSDMGLSTIMINQQWTLHHIHRLACLDESSVEYTKKVILEYVRRGWNPNSVSSVPKRIDFDYDEKPSATEITKYNLLHLACLYKAQEIIKFLVEDLKVDMDSKLEGEKQVELTPLQVLLIGGQWDSAKFLIEKGADLNVRGNLGSLWRYELKFRSYLQLMRKNSSTGNLELNSRLNAVELLVRMGHVRGLPLLDQLLARPDVVWHGANVFHLALEGMNPVYIVKVVKRCADLISKEDLNWVNILNGYGDEPEKEPSLLWLFNILQPKWGDVDTLADLVKHMAQLGYDLNSVGDPPQSSHLTQSPLIFYILMYDLEHCTSDRLLRTILQFDHLQLSVTNLRGMNPVEHLLYKWDRSCSKYNSRSICWKSRHLQQPPILETVKLLLSHGLDVSEMVIGPNFTYHRGFDLIIKMLYRFGAKISEEFFTSHRMCQWGSGKNDVLLKEIKELKGWKEDFDREIGFSLKRISGLRVRKMVKCVGDLKMLDGLPRGLKEAFFWQR